MAQQTKPDVNTIWANAGDTGTPPTTFEIGEGWVAEKPPFQKMNWFQNLINKFVKHVNEYGVPAWDANTNYANNAITYHLGNYYTSNSADNLGNNPTVSGWLAIDFQPAMPPGAIIDWYGNPASVPQGWAICNGTNGTPNLTGLVTVGHGTGYTNQTQGGGVTKTTSSDGSHTHTTNVNGAHTHGITVDNHTLTLDEIPSHNHAFGYERGTSRGSPDNPPGIAVQSQTTQPDTLTDTVGGGSPHNHTASSVSNGNHTHTVNSIGNHNHTVDVRQPYFVLVKLMKL